MKDDRTPIQLLSQLIADLAEYANARLVPHVDIFNANISNNCREGVDEQVQKDICLITPRNQVSETQLLDDELLNHVCISVKSLDSNKHNSDKFLQNQSGTSATSLWSRGGYKPCNKTLNFNAVSLFDEWVMKFYLACLPLWQAVQRLLSSALSLGNVEIRMLCKAVSENSILPVGCFEYLLPFVAWAKISAEVYNNPSSQSGRQL